MPEDTPGLENVEELLPLSPAQVGMLYETLSAPANGRAYVAFVRIDIEGPLSPEALRSALAEIALTPDSGRACFLHEGLDQPVQVIRRDVDLPFAFDDLAGASEAAARVDALQATLRAVEIPLGHAPLMRAHLVRLAEDRHVLLWAIHHMISDGWSVQVIVDDLLARLNGKPARPPGPPYKRHLALLRARDQKADRAFWAQELSSLDGPTLLASGGKPARLAEARAEVQLTEDATAGLGALARDLRVSPAMLLSVGWSLILRRITGRNDVVFGMVTSGRDPRIPGVDRAVGAYMNVVPCRLRIDPNASLRATVERARAAAERRSPFELSALSDATSGGILPFDTILSVRGFASSRTSDPGPVRASSVVVENLTPYAFSMIVDPGLAIRLTAFFDPHRIAPDTARGILDACRDLLETMVARRDARICDLAACPPPALPPLSRAPHLTAAIHAMAHRCPAQAAVQAEDAVLSYRELDGRAAALARKLTDAGIGRGDLVPVLLPRGATAVVAMLGVLYAGAAYVPLDPAYPSARLSDILRQVAAPIVVADDPALIPGFQSIPVPEQGIDTPPLPLDDSDPAYVIFTSGSSGKPKGVVVSHGNLAWSTAARDGVYGCGPEVFLHLSSFAFDSSVVGLYWTLASGGKLIVASPGAEQDPTGLLREASNARVTHLLALPRLWSALMSAGPVPATLNTVIVAGEAVPDDLPRLHRARAPGVRLFNEYGPTEATVWCAAAAITDTDGPVPIGRAPQGAAVEVCDADGHPLPPGIEGELIARGQGIAAGYLQQPEATAAAFIDGPSRRYRTGDRGVMAADGTLYYLGRADTQVKLRGHRVELSEIEALARRVGAPEAAAALAGGRIVLAVTGAADAVRAVLPRHLPAALLPIPVHELRNLPSLPNGKIDRAALCALGGGQTTHFGRPGGFFERRLSELWSRLLKVEAGPETHFFDAGGDSLASVALIAAAEKEGIALRPGDIFAYPALRDLAKVLDERVSEPVAMGTDRLVVVCNAEGNRVPFFMIHGSQRMNAALAAALGKDRPLVFRYSHYIGGKLSLRDSIESLAADATETMREMQPEGPYLIGGYSLGAIIAVEAARQLNSDGNEVAGLFLLDPSFTGRPPTGTPEPLSRRLKRAARCGLAALRLMPRWGEIDQSRVGHAYTLLLARYQPTAWNGPATVFRSTSGRAHGLSTNAMLPTARSIDLPFGHLELQNDQDAIADWSARLAAEIHRFEGYHERS